MKQALIYIAVAVAVLWFIAPNTSEHMQPVTRFLESSPWDNFMNGDETKSLTTADVACYAIDGSAANKRPVKLPGDKHAIICGN